MDWSRLGNESYEVFGRSARVAFPSAYTIPNVTGVRNQNPYGTCWAFAAFASLESTVLRAGTMPNPDFSERHLAWFAYNNADDNSVVFTKKTLDPEEHPTFDQGGNPSMATAILSRGQGPVNEADCPYTAMPGAASNLAGILNVNSVSRLYIAALTEGDNLAPRSETYEAMKDLLTNEGALYVSYFHSWDYYNGLTYYFPPNGIISKGDGGHSVTIIGRDDNY